MNTILKLQNVLIFSLLLTFPLMGLTAEIVLSPGQSNTVQITQQTPTYLEIDVQVSKLQVQEKSTPWGTFTFLDLPEFTGYVLEEGHALLPAIHQLLDIPYGSKVDVEVLQVEWAEINLHEKGFALPVFPYQGPIEKTEEAVRQHQFRMDRTYYQQTEFQTLPLVEFQEIGILRGHRLGQLRLHPVQYLPAENKIKIARKIILRTHFPQADWATTTQKHRQYASLVFEPILRKFLLNHQTITEDLLSYPLHMVVIYDDAFAVALQPFIEWKRQKGIEVTAASVSTIGNSTSAIQAYLQNLYNGTNPPDFVVLVGDMQQIATFNGTTGSHVTDLYYTTLDGSDHLPDVYIGRLSAQNLSQLSPQLEKILPYEQYQLPANAFLDHGCFIATDDSYNYQIAEGTHEYVINTHFIPNNLQFDRLYAITYNATGQDVINAVNAGRFIVNYSGHGSTTSWGGPSVSQTMVNGTTNMGMYPFVISNACLTGSFEISECFGETWVRKPNGGGLAFTGASNSTYWDEDDEWERRAYDGVFWEDYHTLAAFILRGNLGVLNAGYSREHYYFEVYHLFGDPSLMLYWGVPQPMMVSAPQVVFIGNPVFDVTVQGEDSALVSLYMDGTLYGTGLTDATGHVSIQMDPVPTTPGNMLLTITKFNRAPYIDTLQVIPASGPYLYCIQPLINDQNNNGNGIPEAGETISLNLLLVNVGVANATNVQATVSTPDTMVTLLQAQSALGSIVAGDTVVTGNFQMHLSADIPHLHTCTVQLHMEDDQGNVWDQTLSMKIRKGARITLLDTAITFPPTFLNTISERNVTVRNDGPDTLFVTEITSDLVQFTAAPAQLMVPPGGQAAFTVRFTPDTTGLYQSTITIRNSDPIHFLTNLTATGEGIFAPDIATSPDSILAIMDVTDSLTIPIAIMNEGLGELVFNAQIAGHQPGSMPGEGSGGSDNFGHLWIDSDEEDGPQFQWIDISQSGTPINLTGNNATSDPQPIGFDFEFYGQSYSSFRVCTNGWISFNTYTIAYNNVALPSILAPRAMIAPLWDDLNFQPESRVLVGNESNKCIIQFENVYRVSGEGPYTFEVILYENGNIVLQYLSLDSILHDYTVGIQNHLANDGLTIAYNQPYLKDSLAVLISRHSWASVSPLSGTVAPQSSDTIYLTLKTHHFPQGEFWASVQIENNDPDESLIYIPIHLIVDSVLVDIASPDQTELPSDYSLSQNYPNPFNPSTTIRYALPKASRVELAVFNILGQQVRLLVNTHQPAGRYSVTWDGRNDAGEPVASGIYFYRLKSEHRVLMRKMMLIR